MLKAYVTVFQKTMFRVFVCVSVSVGLLQSGVLLSAADRVSLVFGRKQENVVAWTAGKKTKRVGRARRGGREDIHTAGTVSDHLTQRL
jgi:hypothetical protein